MIMRKVLSGVIILIIFVFFIVSFVASIPDEPNVIKTLQEKGYTDIEIINKETKSNRDQDVWVSSSTTIVIAKAKNLEGEYVEIKLSYCYPINTEPIIEVK